MKKLDQPQITDFLSDKQLGQSKFNRIKCAGGNFIEQFCFNRKCKQKMPFVCLKYKCKCNQLHQNCQKAHIKYAVKKLQSRLAKTDNIKLQVQQIFINIINKIIDFQQQILKQIQTDFKCSRFMQFQRKFYDVFVTSTESVDYFDGRKLATLWQMIGREQKDDKQLFENHLKQMKKFEQECFKKVEETQSALNEVVKKSFQKLEQQKKKYEEGLEQKMIKIQNQFDLSQKQIQKLKTEIQIIKEQIKFQNSSIITNSDKSLKRLLQFFNKSPQKIDLVFKASHNNFQMQKYYQQCGHLTDTIIICKTNKDKVIGGYTPLSFNSVKYGHNWVQEWVNELLLRHVWVSEADESGSSFVFSLTQNQKFRLKNKQRAIYRHSNKSFVNFGYDFFRICDKADKNQFNGLLFDNQSYEKNGYANKKQDNLKFNGNEQYKFTVKEWQVLKVHF